MSSEPSPKIIYEDKNMYSIRERLRQSPCTVIPRCGILFSGILSNKKIETLNNEEEEECLIKNLSMVHQDPIKIIKEKEELINTVKDLNVDVKRAMEIIIKLETKSQRLEQNINQIKKNTRRNVFGSKIRLFVNVRRRRRNDIKNSILNKNLNKSDVYVILMDSLLESTHNFYNKVLEAVSGKGGRNLRNMRLKRHTKRKTILPDRSYKTLHAFQVHNGDSFTLLD